MREGCSEGIGCLRAAVLYSLYRTLTEEPRSQGPLGPTPQVSLAHDPFRYPFERRTGHQAAAADCFGQSVFSFRIPGYRSILSASAGSLDAADMAADSSAGDRVVLLL